MTRRGGTAALLATLLVGCAGPGAVTDDPAPPTAAPAHPLADRIWDVRTATFVEPGALYATAATADHLLLGEVHDNPRHHELQTTVLAALVERGRRPSVVFEMMERDQQPAIDAVLAGEDPRADEVATATGFEERGWDWPLYRPLVTQALASGLPIVAGNASAAETRAIVREGLSILDADTRRELGLVTPLPPSAQAELTDVMIDSHCGHATPELARRLVDAQRLRDATMADVLLTKSARGTVLITGAGHARRDFGVPAYLSARRPEAVVVSVRLVEVEAGENEPGVYADRLADLPVPFDFLWFTLPVEREDPCEQFRRGLERLRTR